MFKSNIEYRKYADSKGIVLLFSAPYTQKFNATVERPIRTLVEMALAMARHANTPRRFMHLAMKFAVRLLNRLFRRMPDGSTDVPLWRYKGARVPLNLDRFHPWGCAVHVHVEKKQRTKFEPKTVPCVFFGYDDGASAAILGKIPGFAIIYSAHGHYNDDDFPCRTMEQRGWEPLPTYDQHEDDPLIPWVGPDIHSSQAMVPPQPTTQPDPLVIHGPSQMPIHPRVEHTPVVVPMGRNSQPATEGQELRRSARAWCPSEKALHRIVAGEKEVAALLEECLADEHDSVFLVSEAAAKDPFFQTDLAFSTQDGIFRAVTLRFYTYLVKSVTGGCKLARGSVGATCPFLRSVALYSLQNGRRPHRSD